MPQTMALTASGWGVRVAPSECAVFTVFNTVELARDNRDCPKPGYKRPTDREVSELPPLIISLLHATVDWGGLTDSGTLSCSW